MIEARRNTCSWNSSRGQFTTLHGKSDLKWAEMIASASVLSEIQDGLGPGSYQNGSGYVVLYLCNRTGCSKDGVYHRKISALQMCQMCHNKSSFASNHEWICLYVSKRWVMISNFSKYTGAVSSSNSRVVDAPMLVYRNTRGSISFDNFSEFDFVVMRSFRNNLEYTVHPRNWSQHQAAVWFMLLLEGFGRSADLGRIRDHREDKPKLHTQVNILLLIPLLFVTIVLGVRGIAAVLRHPKRAMVLQVPVCTDQMMRYASEMEAGVKSDAKLRMGIEKVYVRAEKKQRFSAYSTKPALYNPMIPWDKNPLFGADVGGVEQDIPKQN